jgi:(2S)-methylsuccinyl-CoA dehydrogenase
MVAAAAQVDATQETVALAGRASQALEALLADATAAVRARVSSGGKISSERIETEQHAVHGLAWLATYATGVRETVRWAERLAETGSANTWRRCSAASP